MIIVTYKVNRDRMSGLWPTLPGTGKDDNNDMIPWAFIFAFYVQKLCPGGRETVRGSLL